MKHSLTFYVEGPQYIFTMAGSYLDKIHQDKDNKFPLLQVFTITMIVNFRKCLQKYLCEIFNGIVNQLTILILISFESSDIRILS